MFALRLGNALWGNHQYPEDDQPDWFEIGGLAQLARALAWHARGHRFESGILHQDKALQFIVEPFFYVLFCQVVPLTDQVKKLGS